MQRPLSNLGDIYRKLDEHEHAVDHYKRAIQIKPNYYEALKYGISSNRT